MSIFSKLFSRRKDDGNVVGGIEDFMILFRVYCQATIASQVGFNDLSKLPDLRVFKHTYHVPTVNNKIGLGEKKHCQKTAQSIYGISDNFFKEMDQSIRRHCHTLQDIQPYQLQLQGFSQDLMMLMGNLMQLKLRLPSFFKSAMRSMVDKQIHQILTKDVWKDESVRRACISVRKYQQHLGFSEQWMSEFVYTVVMLAKKEKQPQQQ